MKDHIKIIIIDSAMNDLIHEAINVNFHKPDLMFATHQSSFGRGLTNHDVHELNTNWDCTDTMKIKSIGIPIIEDTKIVHEKSKSKFHK